MSRHSIFLAALACNSLALAACVPPADDMGTGSTGSTGGTGTGDCVVLTQSDLAADLTLEAGCYVTDELLLVDGVTLAMQPDVDVAFGSAAGLQVSGTGVLAVAGTATAPVRLHGMAETRGAWAGITLAGAASSANALAGAVVTNPTGVVVGAGSRLSVQGSTLEGASAVALEIQAGATAEVSGATFQDDASPIAVDVAAVGGIAADNTFSSNDDAFVRITGQSVAEDATWNALEVPYHAEGRLRVEAALTLAPGLTLAMPQDQSLEVKVAGQLAAKGTADAPVTFTGVQPEVGFWKGITVESTSSGNVCQFCVVEFAGSSAWTGDPDTQAAVFLPDGGKLLMEDSTIRQSARYALFGRVGSDVTGFARNRLEGNARTIFIGPEQGHAIDPSNTFVDNDDARVRVVHGSGDRVESSQTWAKLSVPWLVMDRFFVAADLTLDAGATLEFAQDAHIVVEMVGSLRAAGTAADPVTLTGADTVAGYWRGLEFRSTSTDNALENTVVEYAGSSAWEGGVDKEAAIYLTDGALVALTGVTLRESAGNGIYVNDGTLACNGVTYEAIAKDDVAGNAMQTCK